MHLVLPLLFLLLGGNPGGKPAMLPESPERHMSEGGSSVLFARSAFAHGYRHGYEEGYGLGNIDINMGRTFRTRSAQFHGLSSGYSSRFGQRKSFDAGFAEGVRAGYSDGYAGKAFRAVDTLRMVAASLPNNANSSDPGNLYFDQGFASGYSQGLHPAQNASTSSIANCSQYSAAAGKEDPLIRQNFCEGHERGQILGQADALALGANHDSVQAFKK